MNRLSDYAGDDPMSTLELERLRNTPPTPPMPDMKRRVWNALEQQSLTHASRASSRASSRLLGTPMMRMAAIVVAVVVLAGTAGAMIATRWIVPVLDRPVRSSGSGDPASRVGQSGTTRRTAGAKARDLASPPEVTAATSELARPEAARALPVTAVTAPLGAKAPRSSVVPAERSTARVIAVPARPAPAGAQARTEVLDALVALRRDHDPVRAGALVDKYLADYPRGALREEALVLAIEAADARGDHLAGWRWARIYEAEYPRGRFRQFARGHNPSNGSR
jgi:hypothetical protein